MTDRLDKPADAVYARLLDLIENPSPAQREHDARLLDQATRVREAFDRLCAVRDAWNEAVHPLRRASIYFTPDHDRRCGELEAGIFRLLAELQGIVAYWLPEPEEEAEEAGPLEDVPNPGEDSP